MKDYPSFKIDFLGCSVVIILEKDWLKTAGIILSKDLVNEERYIDSSAIAFAKDRNYYIAAPKTVKNATLYHECFHILMEICADFDLGIDIENHELQAYLSEYIIEQVIKIKNQKTRTIKHPTKRGTLTKVQIKKMVKGTFDKRKKK